MTLIPSVLEISLRAGREGLGGGGNEAAADELMLKRWQRPAGC